MLKFKKQAMRAGAWFRVLPRLDRALIDLTIRVTESVRSPFLTKSILSIAHKLETFLENKFISAVRDFGFPIAQKLSSLAVQWGHKKAAVWADDTGYATYWTIMKLNGHPPR
ncbi:MAG: hypothetical protein NWF04_00410 [Candidatus Bathyarchaeota archaeon]|nr:hypothetical protein [Candidatus Bathyarchaeota archaeon]